VKKHLTELHGESPWSSAQADTLPIILEPRRFAMLGMTAKRLAKNDWKRFEISPFEAL
jgi:hypothetical protein